MTITDRERRFHELRELYDNGGIDESEFRAEMGKLRFQDAHNHWWTIGATSGQWFWYDGAQWIRGEPPVESASLLPPPETFAAPERLLGDTTSLWPAPERLTPIAPAFTTSAIGRPAL